MMVQNVLVMGGTHFVGRHLVERLLQNPNVELTLFHRGKTNPDLFPDVRHIWGDRNTADIEQLAKQDWDVVIDFSCYYPRSLKNFVQSLLGHVGRYVFVSTVSVYDTETLPTHHTLNEDSPLLSCSLEEEIDHTVYTYGKRKAACERVLVEYSELNSLIFRPGLIYGPYDPTDRSYYWLWRVQQGHLFLVPDPQIRHQWTYAPDFARILSQAVSLAEPAHSTYLTLTHDPLSFEQILQAMSEACFKPLPRIQSVAEEWLTSQGLSYWQDLPLSIPYESLGDCSRLKIDFAPEFSSFKDSWVQSHAHYEGLGWPEPQTGISVARETELLALF